MTEQVKPQKTFLGIPAKRIFWLFVYSLVLCLVVGFVVYYVVSTNTLNNSTDHKSTPSASTDPTRHFKSVSDSEKESNSFTITEPTTKPSILFDLSQNVYDNNSTGQNISPILSYTYPSGWYASGQGPVGTVQSYSPTDNVSTDVNFVGIKVDVYGYVDAKLDGQNLVIKDTNGEVVLTQKTQVAGLPGYIIDTPIENPGFSKTAITRIVFECGEIKWCGLQIYGDKYIEANADMALEFLQNTSITVY
jgi:hypothetical protein